MTIFKQRCGTCKFFVEASCRRYAPPAFNKSNSGPDAICVEGEWPMMRSNLWCGEYREKNYLLRIRIIIKKLLKRHWYSHYPTMGEEE